MRRAWLALLFAPAACLFPDLGSLQGDAASDVSSPDVIDAQPIESGAEASDAGNDAKSEAGYCASLGAAHSLCEDFDETTVFNAQFTSVNLSANGSLANDTTIVVTPPRSLLSSIPAEGTKTGDDAHMKRLFAGTGSKATYAFDFRVDSLPSGGAAGVFATIIVDDGLPARHNLSIYTTDTYAAVEESYSAADGGYVYKDHPLTVAIPIGKWARVTFGFDTTARTCDVSIDGQPALVSAAMDPSWKAGAITMDIGLGYVGSETTAWQARYDDVVFDFQ